MSPPSAIKHCFNTGKIAGSWRASYSLSAPPKLQPDTFILFSHTDRLALLKPDNENMLAPNSSKKYEKTQNFLLFSQEITANKADRAFKIL